MDFRGIKDTVALSNGIPMPWVGLGVFRAEEGEEVVEAVRYALGIGYRSIDTAAIYGNEKGVGEAVRKSDVPRSDVFVTTKVWNSDQGYQSTLAAFEKSLDLLQMDYVDLYLIHWPVSEKFIQTWRALEEIYRSGRARAIGVSNFMENHLSELLASASIPPMVNQVEFHPRLVQPGTDQTRRQVWENTHPDRPSLGPSTRCRHHTEIGASGQNRGQCRYLRF
jgi:diketogulonate reductase-like aldo/keto reductase